MGHVRVAFGAVNVDSWSARSNCLWHRRYACVELGIGGRGIDHVISVVGWSKGAGQGESWIVRK